MSRDYDGSTEARRKRNDLLRDYNNARSDLAQEDLNLACDLHDLHDPTDDPNDIPLIDEESDDTENEAAPNNEQETENEEEQRLEESQSTPARSPQASSRRLDMTPSSSKVLTYAFVSHSHLPR